MKKIIISLTIMILLCTSALATLDRVLSSTQVNKGDTFTLKYAVSGVSPPYFYSIKDEITGGCTLSMGGTSIITTLTSPQIETGIITIQAPSSDTTCQFNGDSKLGSANLVILPQDKVEVGTGNGGAVGGGGLGNIALILAIVIVVFYLFKKR